MGIAGAKQLAPAAREQVLIVEAGLPVRHLEYNRRAPTAPPRIGGRRGRRLEPMGTLAAAVVVGYFVLTRPASTPEQGTPVVVEPIASPPAGETDATPAALPSTEATDGSVASASIRIVG